MKHLQTARAALVALAAIGIISATPSYAAGLDAGALGVYSNQPQYPTHPIDPNIPNGGGIYIATPPDVKVTLKSSSGSNGSMSWTYTVKNIGGKTATGVKIEKVVVRNGFSGSNGIQTETSYETIGDMIGGASKDVVISCAPKNLAPPCWGSSAEAHLTNVDANPGNNWATAP